MEQRGGGRPHVSVIRCRREPRSEEGGAILVLFALSLVALFGFSAVAVDAAHAFVERRDSQAAADVAAIGGGLALIDAPGNAYTKAVTLVDEVMALAQRNLGSGLEWEDCSDPDRPSQFDQSADVVFVKGIDPQYTACISWSSDFADIRVRLPQRNVETTFAKVLGFDTFSVGAFAEVGAVAAGGGGVLPFGILNGDTAGLLCLKTGPQFPVECLSNDTGNFGYLDFRKFGNPAIPTIARCSGDSVDTLKENIAHGVDHDLALAPSSPTDDSGIDNDATIIEDDEECPGSQDVQAVLTETGEKQKVIIDGFVDGISGYPGRLTIDPPGATFTYKGVEIDDVALWEYLTPAAQTLCSNPSTEEEMVTCLADNPGTVLFEDTIAQSPRLAQVPELWQTSFPTGAKLVSFKDFTFVYLQTLYGGCNNDGTCKLEIEPGGTKKVTADDPVVVTAIGIGPDNITQTVKDTFGTPSIETYSLTR